MFVSLSTNLLIVNSTLSSGSRAINAGYKTDAPTLDILGGVYESY